MRGEVKERKKKIKFDWNNIDSRNFNYENKVTSCVCIESPAKKKYYSKE